MNNRVYRLQQVLAKLQTRYILWFLYWMIRHKLSPVTYWHEIQQFPTRAKLKDASEVQTYSTVQNSSNKKLFINIALTEEGSTQKGKSYSELTKSNAALTIYKNDTWEKHNVNGFWWTIFIKHTNEDKEKTNFY